MYALTCVAYRMYEATNSCSVPGAFPSTRSASQRTTATANAAIPHRKTTTRWGIARSRRKNTVTPRPLEVVGDDHADRKRALLGHAPLSLLRRSTEPSLYAFAVPDARDHTRRRRPGGGRDQGQAHRTPTFSSRSLGPGQHLKAELFQRTGSFKARGVLNRVHALSPDERRRGVISVSAGNHAQALAWAAATEEVDALLVMWQGASSAKIAATRGYGATIDLEAAGPGEAFARLHELQEQTGRVLVHPFDDPVVIAGAGTVGLEILEDVPAVDTIVVACGGGGLVTGIAAACVPAGVRVIAVEPEHSNALALGLAAGKPVAVTPQTVADALTAPFAGRLRSTSVAASASRSSS